MGIDRDLAINKIHALKETVESVRTNEESIKLELEGKDGTVVVAESEPISCQKSYQEFDDLRQYVEANVKDTELVKMC
jgi:hypothetical protein